MTPHLDADLAVTLADDRPGMLAKAITCVSAAGINIGSFTDQLQVRERSWRQIFNYDEIKNKP